MLNVLRCLCFALLLLPCLVAAQTPDLAAECAALLPADRPQATGAAAPSLRITAPSDGATLATSQLVVTVATTNFSINAESGQHWHLWLNGQLYGMVYQNAALLDLAPGTYTLCASLGNTDHADLGTPAGVRVTITAPPAGQASPTPAVLPENARVLPESAAPTPLQSSILVVGGLAAVVGGWWLGSRLGQRRK